MADAADQVTADDERAMALFEQRRQARTAESMRGYDPSLPINCVDCGEIIPDARQKAHPHTCRCVTCASDIELRNGWGSPR